MAVIQSSPNQKVVKINKTVCNSVNYYAKINKKAMYQAMSRLNGRKASAFILWCYFASNQDKYEFALSNKAISDTIGMKKDAYDTAVKLLIEEKYLVNISGNRYNFYEIPQE